MATPEWNRSRTPTYRSWDNMIQRCTNPNYEGFPHYGERGIMICERWFSYENFLEDMGPRPKGTTLDRIDNNGHYEPGNCRWADNKTQAKNKRAPSRKPARMVIFQGKRMTLNEASKLAGIKYSTVVGRLYRGWSVEEALS